MRAPISVIIPTLDAAEPLPACLAALMEGLDAGLVRELIVSDGGSADATGAIAQAWGAVVLRWYAGPGGDTLSERQVRHRSKAVRQAIDIDSKMTLPLWLTKC